MRKHNQLNLLISGCVCAFLELAKWHYGTNHPSGSSLGRAVLLSSASCGGLVDSFSFCVGTSTIVGLLTSRLGSHVVKISQI